MTSERVAVFCAGWFCGWFVTVVVFALWKAV